MTRNGRWNRTTELMGYEGLQAYVGDIHNHCGISYGHGSIEDAYANAKLQLDFASVTGHAWWHDIPRDDPRLRYMVDYHVRGFEKLAGCWEEVQEITDTVQEEGRFITFLSFEWHSRAFGDQCVYYRDGRGEILRPDSLLELRQQLRDLRKRGVAAMVLPHHLGYLRGHRGANWDAYSPELSPVVEIMSMHGGSASDDGPRPYLHVMGPRDGRGTARHGLNMGHVFGVIGSTDHHSAHPGSYGHGRAGVWADGLSRTSIWDAIWQRRTYALTGDPIRLATTVNGAPMGAITRPATRRQITAQAVGRGAVDYIDVLRNGELLQRVSGSDQRRAAGPDFTGTVGLAVGWGEVGIPSYWDVHLGIKGGTLLDVEPRLRGEDIVMPAAKEPETYRLSTWGREGDHGVWLRTRTSGNANVVTDGTQGLSLRVDGDDRTRVVASINGTPVEHPIGELRLGSRAGYLGDYGTAAYRFERAVSDAERTVRVELEDERTEDACDWYQVTVRQRNDQWAWSSPTWVGVDGGMNEGRLEGRTVIESGR